MVNTVQLIGRVGKDPETVKKETFNVSKITLATSEKIKDKETTEWHNLVFYNKLADMVEKYLKKGMMIFVEGRINYRSYKTENGEMRYVTEITCEKMKILSSKNNNSNDPF